MKTFVNFTSFVLLATLTFTEINAQNSLATTGKIEITTPLFSGISYVKGVKTETYRSVIDNYLLNNLVYPEGALNCCNQGTEVVQFTVLPTGNLVNIKVLNSVCPKIDDEVIRVLNTTNGMWIPGTQNGNPVEMQKEILITFHLEGFHAGTDAEYFTKKAKNWYNRGNQALFEQNNPEKALKCYNKAILYKPLEDALLFARGMAKYELDDLTGAKEDWNRMKSLVDRGGNENNLLLVYENFKELQGYKEFSK